MSIKYSEIFSANQVLSAGPNDIIVIAVVDGASSTGYTTKAIKKSNLIADPLFTSLTTVGTTGASTLVSGVLKVYKIDKFENEIFLYHIHKNSLISELTSLDNESIYCYSNSEFMEDSVILEVNFTEFKNRFLAKNILIKYSI